MSHTPKHSKMYTFILQLFKKPPDGFCTHPLFASSITLIFGGLFLHRISRILKAKLDWLKMPTIEFSRQKCVTKRENPNSSKLSWMEIKKPPKGHTKNIPFVFCTISKSRICHILSPRVEYSYQVGFDSDGSSVIVDNSYNAHIWSEEDMFTDKIDPIISNGLATIGGNYIIPILFGII